MKKNPINLSAAAVYVAQDKGVLNNFFTNTVGNKFGGGPGSPVKAANFREIISFTIDILLLAAASIAVIFLIYGGYQYVIARGNEEEMEKAKHTMEASVWGLVVIVMSFAVIRIVSTLLLQGKAGLGL